MSQRPSTAQVPHAISRRLVVRVEETAGLLDFVMRQLDGIGRNKAKSILTHGGVTVDGVVQTRYDFPLEPGEVVEIARRPSQSSVSLNYYTIIYEDPWLIVVDKQPGVLSVPVGRGSLNLKHMLDQYFVKTHQRCTAHVVHRLDCRTSGLMVYSKSLEVREAMHEDWHSTVFDRRYVAVVEGQFDRPSGRVTSWLTEDINYKMFSSPVDNGGKLAITNWWLMQQGRNCALVELRLQTGRKNQIRVHMSDLGHPVVGDGKYGGGQPYHNCRMFLHAFRLAFYHPVTHEPLEFDTPIPVDFLARVNQ